MNSVNNKDFDTLPRHVGIIMDGNGRWAERQGKSRVMGHKQGTESVKAVMERAVDLGIEAVTLYAFSTENWSRPKQEVDFLMRLFEEYLTNQRAHMQEHDIRLMAIGNRDRLPDFVRAPLERHIEETKDHKQATLCLAVDYGARDEILRAAKAMAKDACQGKIDLDQVSESDFDGYLDTHGLPELDLIIRTSGEIRLSNFLLWQAAYAEFYFTETLWPDFGKNEFDQALTAFSKRIRRKGNVHA